MSRYLNPHNDVDPEFLTIPEIKQALDLSEEVGFTRSQLETYDKYWDWVSTQKTLTKGFYDKGMKDGRYEEKLEIAKKLLATGMSLEQASQITQLPIEVLRNL